MLFTGVCQVHFIFRHKNPKSGEYEEKHLKSPPTPSIEKNTILYTLVVKYVRLSERTRDSC